MLDIEENFLEKEKAEPLSIKTQKRRIWKNVIILSIIILFSYTSFTGMANLQSSLHRDQGMGTINLSVRLAVYGFSSLFLATTMIRILGHKWTITVSLTNFLFWNLGNGFGVWATMVPASVISGLLSAPLWTTKGAYLFVLGKEYAKLTNTKTDRATMLFFGVFSTIYSCSFVISNIISSAILMGSPVDRTTAPTKEEVQQYCGFKDCHREEQFGNHTLFQKPDKSVIWTLVGVYTVLVVVSIIISGVLLDQLYNVVTDVEDQHTKPLREEICKMFLACLRLMKDYRIWLLVPINWSNSSLQSFWTAEFNGSWVACALGIWMVGWVSLPRNIIMSPIAYTTGYICKKFGPLLPMFVGFISGILVLVVLIFWSIQTDYPWVFFLLSGLFGMNDGIMDTIVPPLYGATFPGQTTASFAAYNFFWVIIASITYGYSHYFCSDVKLYIVLFLLVLGLVCSVVLELDSKKKKERNENKDEIIIEEKQLTKL